MGIVYALLAYVLLFCGLALAWLGKFDSATYFTAVSVVGFLFAMDSQPRA